MLPECPNAIGTELPVARLGIVRHDSEGLRIGAIDDHPVILAGLGEALRWHLPESSVSPIARTVDEFLGTGIEVDLVLLDVELHDSSDAADNVGRLKSREWPVVLFTQEQREHLVARAFRAGADGLLSKGEDLAVIARAVATVASGQPYLSPDWAAALASDEEWITPSLAPREIEALRFYAAGMKLVSVARQLGVSEDTAKTYLLRARAKYAEAGRPTYTKTDLYIRAVEDGILPQPQTRPPS